MNFLKSIAKVALAPVTSGLSLAGDDTLARVPILGGMLGAKTDSEKALLKKQEEMARDAKRRQQLNEQARLNALGQQMLAFNPQNQMMAQMFGPEAAFTPEQMGAMVADPGAMSDADYQKAYEESLRTGKPLQGVNRADLDRMQANKRRQAQVTQNTTPLGPGPAPLQPRTPQAARRF